MKVVVVICLVGAVPIAHCTPVSHSEALTQLSGAEITWANSAPRNFDYMIFTGGDFGGAIHKVSVRGPVCHSKWRSNRKTHFERWKNEKCDGHKISDIYAELRRILEHGAARTDIDVRFNAKYGFIEKLSVKPGDEIPDQDWFVGVYNFNER